MNCVELVVLENKIPETFNQSLLKLLTAVGSTRSIPEFIPEFRSSGVPEFRSSGVLEFWSSQVYQFLNLPFFDFQNLPGSPKLSRLSFLLFLVFSFSHFLILRTPELFLCSGTILVSLVDLFIQLPNILLVFFSSSVLQFFSSSVLQNQNYNLNTHFHS
jgi:hypothetical protein